MSWKQWQILFSWAPKSLWMVTATMKLKDIHFLEEKSCDKPRQCIKKHRDHFTDNALSKLCFFQCHVWMWELDHKEGWAPKYWCFRIVVLEKTLESPLDCKEIKLVNPKGSQPLIFIGRTDAEAEAPIVWPPDAKRWFTGKDTDAGKDWVLRGEQEGGHRG